MTILRTIWSTSYYSGSNSAMNTVLIKYVYKLCNVFIVGSVMLFHDHFILLYLQCSKPNRVLAERSPSPLWQEEPDSDS